VALKWLVQQEISAVTAANNATYIREDVDLWSFQLTAAEMDTLAAI
jgi:diketogulonate reductase-like aldo/keto reductase